MAIGYAAALLIGISLGLIGGGGSILTVPVFVYLMGIAPSLATGYSLFVVGLAAAVGAWRYLRQGEIDLKTAAIFGLPSVLSVYATRKWLMPSIPDTVFAIGGYAVSKDLLIMTIFATVMLMASLSMFSDRSGLKKKEFSTAIRTLLIALEGVVVGGVTGFVGAGGGFLIVPSLVVLVGQPMKVAIGTSLTIIAVKSLIGFIGDLSAGTAVDWSLLLPFTAIAIVGIFAGTFLASRVDGAKLKKGFGVFVLVMAVFIAYKEFF